MLHRKTIFSQTDFLKTKRLENSIIFNRNHKITYFFLNRLVIIHCGNRFVKKKIFSFDINYTFGSFGLTKKPFRKPIILKLPIKI